MKRYEIYKDSGIQWVGEIPSHWDVVKTSYLFDDIGSGTTPNTNDDSLYDTDNGINWLQTGDLNDGHITKTSKKISQKAIEGNGTLRLYPINSLVIALYGATIGKVGVLDIESTTNQACCVLPPSDKISTDFAYYIFLASKEALLNLASGGGQPNISQAIIKNHRIPYPSYTEQQSIVSFLENKVSQIDATIAEKEQMLEDIKAYRSAIISEAVTKGLDKNVEMKDSGIEWIGIIPKTWKIVRIKHILDYKTDSLRVGPFGSSLSGNDFKTEGYWVYNQRVVLDNNFNSNDTFVSQEKYKELSSFKVFAGDILLTTRGTIGKVAIVPNTFHEGVLHPCLIRFRVDDSIVNKDFLAYYFNDTNLILDQVKYNSNSTTIDVIYSYTLKELIVSLPTLDVQNDIVAHLNYKVQKIDEMLKEASQSVENLKSYKSTLITEAVTGKIDLREWKPKEENV